ncbi:FAD/NAD(P)-binding domain-containing protein [Exidia glandulosa HHB12029]|uniref:FAD/NAD(P)-binding domain-containing protein n=1 Tax=Exidia glandulosa HHB12029 TaxID=1314781 RepID=A0A165HZJ4_EXIGL|nr:FAD/NAD(P)-binding domain-containing protein [Exidia glandulosa HHB12029]
MPMLSPRAAVELCRLPAPVLTKPDDLASPPKSPLYDSLTTNLPHPVMCYGSFPLFPPETPLFPPARAVLEYLRAFVDRFTLRPHIRCNARVVSVEPLGGPSEGPWKVTLSTGESREFDCVVAATGRYRTPYVPQLLLDGLQARLRAGTAMHAAWYRNPEPYEGKRVLVVGGGPSGSDACAACAEVCERVWWAAAAFATKVQPGSLPNNVLLRGRIASLHDQPDGALVVRWADDTEEVIDVDVVILATGYELTYRFLGPGFLSCTPTADPAFPFEPDAPIAHLYNSPQAIMPLAKHVFPLSTCPDPTFAFVGLTWKLAPLPIVEAQARAAAKVFERSLARKHGSQLPPALDVEEERTALLARHKALAVEGATYAERMWHAIPEEEQFQYRRELLRFANGRVTDDEEREMQWFEKAYADKVVLRQRWREIEKRAEDKRWVQGIGYGEREAALRSWVELMARIVEAPAQVSSNQSDLNAVTP